MFFPFFQYLCSHNCSIKCRNYARIRHLRNAGGNNRNHADATAKGPTVTQETYKKQYNNLRFNYIMIKSQDIKKGTCIRMDGKLYFCIDFLHVKPGKGNTIMRTTLKDVVSGRVLEKRFNIGEALEDVRVERRPYQFLYMEGNDYIFMNQETYDQIPIAKDLITGVDFMKESDIVEVVSDADTETVLYAEMPVKTNLRITHSEPGVKGDTATNATKPATLETGVEVRVPLFINEGDLIQVDTRDGSYLQRVKE